MLVVLEIAFAAVVIYLLITQVIAPTVNGTKLFPLFRSDELSAEADKLRDSLETSQSVANLANAAKDIQSKAEAVKSSLDNLKEKAAATAEAAQKEAQNLTGKQ